MKPFLMLLFCFMFVLATVANGQLLLQENFMTPTTDITTTGTWTLVNNVGATTSGPPNIVVYDGIGLQYPGYFESGVGNAAYLVGAGQDAQIAFPTTAMTGTFYLAFMVKIDSVSTTGDYFWMVRNSSNHNRWRGWVKRSAAGEDSCFFGVSKGGTAQAGSYSTKKFKLGVSTTSTRWRRQMQSSHCGSILRHRHLGRPMPQIRPWQIMSKQGRPTMQHWA
jgi:hypothetical protein